MIVQPFWGSLQRRLTRTPETPKIQKSQQIQIGVGKYLEIQTSSEILKLENLEIKKSYFEGNLKGAFLKLCPILNFET